jgi:molybdate transport system substrate-binding protein
VPGFEKSTAHKVTTTWGGVNEVADKVAAGETVDIVLLPVKQIDDLIRQGKLDRANTVVIAKSGVGVAVRPGTPKIDIRSSDSIKKALLAAGNRIAYSTGPSGVHMAAVIKQWGLSDQLKSKIVVTPPNTQVAEVLARGDADIGFQQVSELLHAPGIVYLGQLPSDIDEITVFAAALHTHAQNADAAKRSSRISARPPPLRSSKKPAWSRKETWGAFERVACRPASGVLTRVVASSRSSILRQTRARVPRSVRAACIR